MLWKNRKVLVTGADGFIGSHLVERLVTQGCRVRAFVYYNSFNSWGWLDHASLQVAKCIEIFPGDIRDPNGVAEACRGVDTIFHLAALIGIPFSYHSPDSYIDTNVKGTLNILQAARKCKVKKVIHTSTSEVYGTAQYAPIDEKHPINPQSPYAASKSAADSLALSFYSSFDLPVVVLRPFNTYGPRQSARAVIPTILTQVCAGQKSVKLGNLQVTRDFNFVSDTVEAFLRLAESDGGPGEVFNAGSGLETSLREVIAAIRKITGIDFKVVVGKERLRPQKSEVERLVCNADKLRGVSGWKPRVSLEEGLKQTYLWIRKNRHRYKEGIYNV